MAHGTAGGISWPTYRRILSKHRFFIILSASGVLVGSAIISLFIPDTYTATARVLPPCEDGTVKARILSEMPYSSNGLSENLLGVKTNALLWAELLKTRSLHESVIKHFDMKQVFGTTIMCEAREILAGKISVEKSRAGILSIHVEDSQPETAAKIANVLVHELDRLNRELDTTQWQRTRAFIEERLKATREELMQSEERLRAFNETSKAVKLDYQSRTLIETIGTTRGQLLAKEVELGSLMQYADAQNPKVVLLRTEVENLRKRIDELEGKTGQDRTRMNGVLIPPAKMAGVTMQYTRLVRELKVQEMLFDQLSQQYEVARVQEAKNCPVLLVLEQATPPDKPSGFRKPKIIFFSTSAAVFLAALSVIILEKNPFTREKRLP